MGAEEQIINSPCTFLPSFGTILACYGTEFYLQRSRN